MRLTTRWFGFICLAIASVALAFSLGVMAGKAIKPTKVGRWLRNSGGASGDLRSDLPLERVLAQGPAESVPTPVGSESPTLTPEQPAPRSDAPTLVPQQPAAPSETPALIPEQPLAISQTPTYTDEQILEDPNLPVPPGWSFSCH